MSSLKSDNIIERRKETKSEHHYQPSAECKFLVNNNIEGNRNSVAAYPSRLLKQFTPAESKSVRLRWMQGHGQGQEQRQATIESRITLRCGLSWSLRAFCVALFCLSRCLSVSLSRCLSVVCKQQQQLNRHRFHIVNCLQHSACPCPPQPSPIINSSRRRSRSQSSSSQY